MDLRTGRRGVIILGMHRSGTSAVTRVVNLLGARLPDDLVAPASDNPLGFWESERAIALNEAFMREIGVSPDNTDAIPSAAFRSDAAALFTRRIRDFLEEAFPDASLFALKDPRIARLAPPWTAALREFGAEVGFVVPFRAPGEVARSLAARESIPVDHSMLLWLRYVLDAERASRNFPRVFVDYEALARDWRGEVEKMSRRLGLDWPKLNARSAAEIDDFLHPTREPATAQSGAASVLTALADECYRIHRQAAESDVVDSDRLDEIAAELGRAEAMHLPRLTRVARALDEERAQVAALSATVAGLEAALAETRARQAQDEAAALAERTREAEARRAAEERAVDLEGRLDALQAAAAEAEDRARAELGSRAEIEAELRARLAMLAGMSETREAEHHAAVEALALQHRAALDTLEAEHRATTEAVEAGHVRALSAAVQGERALGERLLEVFAETRREQERAEAAERGAQVLSDELQRARHEARALQARIRTEASRHRDHLARALGARDEAARRLHVTQEALDAQTARVDLILGSRSWAFGRPVRGLSRVARRLLRGGF